MDDIENFVGSKLNDFRNAVGQAASGLGTDVHNAIAGPTPQPGQVSPNYDFGTRLLTSLPDTSGLPSAFENIPQLHVADRWDAPVVGGAAQMAQGFLNTPQQSVKNAALLGEDINQGATPQAMIGHAAGAAMLPLTIASFGAAGAAGIGGKFLAGAKYGGGFGALQGLNQGANDSSVGEQLKGAILPTLSNAALGGLGNLASPFVTRVGNGLSNLTRDVFSDPALAAAFQSEQGFFRIDNPAVKYRDIADLTSHESVDPATVEQYKQQIQSGQPIQPIYVKQEGDGFGVEDGKHRLEAYRQLGATQIPTISLDPVKKSEISDWFNNQRGSVQLGPAGEKGIDQEAVSKYGDKANPQEIQASYQQAAQNKPVLDNVLGQTAQETGARVETNFKNPDTMAEKIVEKNADQPGRDYTASDVNDVYRGRMIYPDKGTLYQGVERFKNNAQAQGLQIDKESDFFKHPQEGGYQGYHIDVKMPSGQTQEVQFHTEKSLAASLATHDAHADFGDDMPASVEKQVAAQNHQIMDATNPQAKAISDAIEAKNTPGMAEAQAKAAQVINGQEPTLPWEVKNPEAVNQMEANNFTKSPPPAEPQQGGTAAVNPKLVAQQARLAHSGAMNAIMVRANNLARIADQTLQTPKDNMAFRLGMEDPTNMPKQFGELAKAYSDFTDYVFKSLKETNPATRANYVQDYFTHIWDLSTPEDQQAFNDLMAKNAKNFQSGFGKERIFATLQEGLAAGLKLKNPNVSQDILQYANSMGKQIASGAYNKKMNELRPGGAIPESAGGAATYNHKGELFSQSNVPGNKGVFIDPEIQAFQKTYNPSVFASNKVISFLDKVNQIDKEVKLGGGLFHAVNTTLRQAVNDPRVIPQAIANSFLPRENTAFIQKAVNDGVTDYGSKVGITYSQSGDLGPQEAVTNLKSLNPLTVMNNRVFGGLINTYKINLTRAVMNKFPDLSDPTQFAQAQAIGAQINDLMGGLNYEAIGRDKTGQQLLRFAGLAPDFSEGTLRQIAQAFNPLNYASDIQRPAALFALRQVVGQAALLATISVIGTKLATGNYPSSLQSLISQNILTPQVGLPNNSTFNNPKTGVTRSAELPKPELSTLVSALPGVGDPSHFLQARGSGIVSAAGSLLSGKDYFGNPLVPVNEADNLTNRAKALIPSNLPIPVVQAGTVMAGKTTPADAALNIAGARVVNNPNDPRVIATNQYFNALKQASDSLRNPNDQNIFNSVLHPVTKDAAGNPLVDKTPYNKPTQFAALLNNSNLLSTEQAFQQSQPAHHPMWDLKPDQLRAYLQEQLINGVDPSGDKATVNTLKSVLPAGFSQQVSQYYNNLQAQGVQLPQNNNFVNTPPGVQNFWNQYHNLPLGSGQRSAMLNTPLGQQALGLLQQQTNLTNAQRADMGLPMLNPSSSSGGSSSSLPGTASQRSYGRRMFITSQKPKLVHLSQAVSVKSPKVSKLKAAKGKTIRLTSPLKVPNIAKGKIPQVKL